MPLTNLLSLATFLLLTQPQSIVSLNSQLQATQYSIADYVGTWVAHTPKGDFKLILTERKNVRLPNGQIYNIIVGRHFYLDSRNESLSKSEDNFVLVGIPGLSKTNELPMTFTDEVNHKTAEVNLSFDRDNLQKMHWKVVRENEAHTIDPAKKVLLGISVPTDIILERAK